MTVLELVRLALSRLRTNRLRAGLTMLGIIIGVAAIVALVGVAEGTTANIERQLAALGTNLLTVTPGFSQAGESSLTLDDSAAIREIPTIAGVAPEAQTQLTVEAGDESTTTSIVGTTPDYAAVRAYDVWAGTFLTTPSVERDLRVAVLGASTAEDLELDQTDLGTEISIGGLPFTLIGILQPKGGLGFQDPDDQVLVPIGVIGRHFIGGETVRTIGVSATSPDAIDAAKTAITSLLRERHELAADADDDFSIFDQAQLLEAVSTISATLTILLGGIASIALVVGGIGIMNIMLVSVRERTREIGIRKAVGARDRDVLAQFLIEALTLSVLGGTIGIVLGLLASAAIGGFAGWGFTFSPLTVVVALAFSLGVGVVFGVWPARQAARLDPIAALRYE
jgi:putative ABC transport system permease protein